MKSNSGLFGQKVGDTRVVPLVLKIVGLFTVFLLISNFASNYINLILNRGELIRLANQLLVKDLKDIYNFATNQYDIYQFSGNLNETISAMESNASKELKGEKSLACGIKKDGSFFFWASKGKKQALFSDEKSLKRILADFTAGQQEGLLFFNLGGSEFFGVYKYIEKWDCFLLRAEELNEFYSQTTLIFFRVAIIIMIMTIFCIVVGNFLVRYILRFVSRITQSLMAMQTNQKLELIDLGDAPNDDVTYLGASFNALSSSIDNLMNIFRKFVTKDVALQAYREREIRLEGTTKELTILFSDIKGFTFMTETLGNDIINLLNLHYDRAIRHIHNENGIVGSIIGDALLAVYGTMKTGTNKSVEAIRSAYKIQEVAASLRSEMTERKEEIVRKRGALTNAEERIFRAILLEVGVGIDGGDVFYGNIGSYERMTNTVIGDNVNSSSRLEGLTRIYRVPLITSEYIKNEVVREFEEYKFVELDTVQVKGKTEGKKIFWPVDIKFLNQELEQEIESFSKGLAAYYNGDWNTAREAWATCTLPLVSVFKDRIESTSCPEGWNGIWTMTTK